MEYLAAFSLGLMGSLHCVGMCGPLMLSVSTPGSWKQPVLYQTGRLTTYVFLGFILGAFGFGLQLWNAQSLITILSGLLLIAFALLRWDPAQLLQRISGYGTFQLAVRKKMSSVIKKDSFQAHYGLGVCNGFLPCGLVYLAIVGAANMPTPTMGGGFMLAFGLGTLPLLAATLYAGRRVLFLQPNLLAKWSPLIMAAMGILLIWRGWNAHVPLDFYRYQDVFFPPMCH